MNRFFIKRSTRSFLRTSFLMATLLMSATAYGEMPEWQLRDNRWCLKADTSLACIDNPSIIKKSFFGGANIEVTIEGQERKIFLSFEYRDSEDDADRILLDSPFVFVGKEHLGKLIIEEYQVRLGDLPDSITTSFVIRHPMVFSMLIVGGTPETKKAFVMRFVREWNGNSKT